MTAKDWLRVLLTAGGLTLCAVWFWRWLCEWVEGRGPRL